MAMSTCSKCISHSFEVFENEPWGSNYKLIFVQCSQCGAVVGVLDFFNIGDQCQQIKKALNIR